MARNFNELRAKMSPERRNRIKEGAKAMMAGERTGRLYRLANGALMLIRRLIG